MQRKTLNERLTNKYQLIVRNEENFSDRWTFSFNFAKLLVLITLILVLFYALSTGINFLGSYLLGVGGNSEKAQELITMAAKVDSIAYELDVKDRYILSFKTMLNGGEVPEKNTISTLIDKKPDEKMSKEEEEFRRKFEKEVPDPYYKAKEGFSQLFFFAPISGQVSDINVNGVLSGVSVQATKTKSIKAIDGGIVLLKSINEDSTFKVILQHTTGLVTVYDNIKYPIVKTGSNVLKGSEIAAPAVQKVTFSMIYNGKYLNPRAYIAWDK